MSWRGDKSQAQAPEQKKILVQLLFAHILIIIIDIIALGIECADILDWQAAIKPFVYGIKLKIEFFILNRLIYLVQPPGSRGGVSYNNNINEPSNEQMKGLEANQDTRNPGLQRAYPAKVNTQGMGHGVRFVDVTSGNILK